ncbi:MBL fold metallo-hydrolase [Xylanimonas oleitrophica]|uniref:MBL fold metallo-hydrolase n=1 Tax=Xylanimonas oleitrophica TaxID=2607479 RepID=A0A2W5YCM9_9MICO|nr:MBL fold metallo-hydrolase [Xylanimonas oleitrophica]PZR51921.1 MBL fold metallo-hydrolase [Xylanimonas oleitrophica]
MTPSPTTPVTDLGGAALRVLSVGPMDNNAYLLTAHDGGAQVLVDAAAEPDRLLRLAREGTPTGRLDVVVTTHRHHDHVGALAPVVRATGARTVAGADDADAIEEAAGVRVTERLHHGATLVAAPLRLEIVHLRGHTPGSIALAYREPAGRAHLFTGDSLFPGGVGSTDRDPARFDRLLADVTTRLFDRFADDTVVHPGHGRPTTLGAERPHLGAWRERGW